ncbi:MAG: LapA family protein [Cyanobacteria bacterium J06639_1]
MKVRQIWGVGILILTSLVLLTLTWHNRSSDVGIVWLGSESQSLPLGWAIARAFGVGALVGVPLAGGSWLADWWQQRRSQRRFKHVVARLERSTYAPLPAAMSNPYQVDPKYAREAVGSATNASDWSDDTQWQDSEPKDSNWGA